MADKFKHKTDEERQKESESWNNWQPGSGRKGWSPFTKPAPSAQWRDSSGRPLKSDGSLDVEKFIQERSKDE